MSVIAFNLAMPPKEAAHLVMVYEHAQVILEYGSGGSTLLAARLPGKHVLAVESDAVFLCRLNTELMQLRTGTRVATRYSDIGPVKDWGKPENDSGWYGYPDYALGIWREEWFVQPDTVLIDGRFRVACFLVCAVLTRKPLTILFDDYRPRPNYHVVERIARPKKRVGRMAVFELAPGKVSARAALELAPYLYDPA